MKTRQQTDNILDAVIVGAGFAGLYMLHRLNKLGLRARVLEAAEGVGGTWYWNRYPGARCDIESLQYSYSFDPSLQQEWSWSERYATQSEILQYANHVADRFKLRSSITFNTNVESATYSETENLWHIKTTSDGQGQTTCRAKFCIMATGCLSTAYLPNIPGLDTFAGNIYHTANWPHRPIDLRKRNVALIGTGSSGIQFVTASAPVVSSLTVFQRTANYVIPANNLPLTEDEQNHIKANYGALREKAKLSRNGVAFDFVHTPAMTLTKKERLAHYEQRWQRGGLTFAGAFPDLILDAEANATAANFVQQKIREIVNDADTADLLSPTSTFACKRLCVASGYYEAFNRDNVSLVDISKSGIDRITASGIHANGQDYEVDDIVMATGFDAMTGTLLKINISGKNYHTLAQHWQGGPISYLGLMVSGFPNLFTITGPGSPSVLSNVLGSIEYHVDWIATLLQHMQERKLGVVEATEQAENAWVDNVNQVVDRTLYRTCDSWYLGANVSRKKRVFMPYPGVPSYVEEVDRMVADGYTGLSMN